MTYDTAETSAFGLQVTDYYRSLAHDSPSDPIRKQFIPTAFEFDQKDYETSDPLGESIHAVLPRLVHQYEDRVLLLVTDRCFVHCRHCFRRSFTGGQSGPIPGKELDDVLAYLKRHPEVQEILLSGGDPLTLTDRALGELLKGVRTARPDIIIRIGTRAPVVLPSRITEGLAALLAGYKPVWVVSQWNHPAELTDESLKAVSYLVDRGIPVLNQSVLLKGINDDLRTLGELFHGLVRMRVKPYYLFQGDLAKGTAHFRTNLRFGIALADELRGKISGLAMPAFAVDLPGGGGKVLLSSGSIQREENGFFVISGRDGKEYLYPNEPQ